ncbi:MAG: glycogen debranching enzyme N-terminal domain-containing protein [Deltaproteobacteria bacterium]|nr:glycogen debranching enzyme N-terminal domain-containing protein [Deltaproteobacteria bacterium]
MNPGHLRQEPTPGTHILLFRGDMQRFTLVLDSGTKGKAWLRTNVGHAGISRQEIISEIQDEIPRSGRDWFDIPMERVDETCFLVTLPLSEVGHFEAKAFFLKDGETVPVWPEGNNIALNVCPADTCCANIIYNTFVRQFGPNKKKNDADYEANKDVIQSLDGKGFTVIPPSGTFRDLIKELDFIIHDLGCRYIQLLPVHPTPTTYARMGRFGSPYAALNFTDVDPALAVFDPKATPLEQFTELVDAIHAGDAKIILDIAINHTGWAATLHESHPEWLARNEDGSIEVPGAWGVVWADLTRLDYSDTKLWQYMADVFMTWCRRGVDGFRCDAGYMIPIPAWTYIVSMVREAYPDTVFLLEGLGGKKSVSRQILNRANFDWAYSELFQNYTKDQIEHYLPGPIDISATEGIMVHFAETHDNTRLASRSKRFAKMRTALCALFASNGAFGFAGGVEWYAEDKIDVHKATSLNWGASYNQVEHIIRLNTILKIHPAFHDQARLKMIHTHGDNQVFLLRHHIPTGKKIMVFANLDEDNAGNVSWDQKETEIDSNDFFDLLTGKKVVLTVTRDRRNIRLEPCEVLCITPDISDIDLIESTGPVQLVLPERIRKQRFYAKAIDVYLYYNSVRDMTDFDRDEAARALMDDPVGFCQSMNHEGEESRVTVWNWPEDKRREVMVPPHHFLLIKADNSFRAKLTDGINTICHEESLPLNDGTFFVVFSPLSVPHVQRNIQLKISVYTPEHSEHADASLLYLTYGRDAVVKQIFLRHDILHADLLFLGSNRLGGMLRSYIAWGKLQSRYDALLAANLHPSVPENRHVMFTRCRAWIFYQGYSQEIGLDCLDSFQFDAHSRGCWRYNVPTGQGEHIALSVCLEMSEEDNAVRVTFSRFFSKASSAHLPDHKPVRLIMRPDIEDRSFHETTKAYQGSEHMWPGAIVADDDGFIFSPSDDRHLHIAVKPGQFVSEPEWQYMVSRSIDKERNLDPDSDLFSPGYFLSFIKGGDTAVLTAEVCNKPGIAKSSNAQFSSGSLPDDDRKYDYLRPDKAMSFAMGRFVVRRDGLKTVIAGYPWFLDWGRDSIIFARGLISAGKTEDAEAVLKQFAQFEKHGTLPNMITGDDDRNRDTSDAPLWLVTACDELSQSWGSDMFFDEVCNGRTVREILLSIGESMIEGTSNGIKIDPESGLLFSPAHFTWMDTNHPAGTPRQGYPIEIQALWYRALLVLSGIDSNNNKSKWKKISEQVGRSIHDLYFFKDKGYFSDCLHADPGESAKNGKKDDALRPNQLLTVTLGAVEDRVLCRQVLDACSILLVPGAIRSLADKPLDMPLRITHYGRLLNNPHYPYKGCYSGDEDTERKIAYHNGTAWTWLFPSFCEAWAKVYGRAGRETALSLLSSSTKIINKGTVGYVPEILDGDYPHTQRGCDAQAWGVSEFLRVWIQLTSE